jgi:tricarballylate dehydrogenase
MSAMASRWRFGNWSGRHAVSWERYAPEFGDLSIPESSYRHSFPLSLMINADGKRFVDEGIEFYNYTYAKYGAEVLKQPGQFAYQVFDAKTKPLLRPEYGDKQVTRVVANSLEELAKKMEGVNPEGFLKTVREYNEAVMKDVPFDHSIKDGKGTVGIDPPKSNWANVLDTAPYEAYAVTCGITFTFGGLRTEPETGQVVDVNFHPIDGLYTAGEMVGGIFYFNYPAGTGLVSGAVFGKLAGAAAGAAALAAKPAGKAAGARVSA